MLLYVDAMQGLKTLKIKSCFFPFFIFGVPFEIPKLYTFANCLNNLLLLVIFGLKVYNSCMYFVWRSLLWQIIKHSALPSAGDKHTACYKTVLKLTFVFPKKNEMFLFGTIFKTIEIWVFIIWNMNSFICIL
jgi:hypothetical protein